MDEAGAAKKQSHDKSHDQSYYHLEGVVLLPYVLHTVVLTVFGWFFIYIQVIQGLKFGPISDRKYGGKFPEIKKESHILFACCGLKIISSDVKSKMVT